MQKKRVHDFLQKVSIMSAAFIHPEGPVSTILLFQVEPDLTMCFATRKNSYKAQAIEADPRMSYSVWVDKEMLVQGKGRVEQVTDAAQVTEILDKLVESVARVGDFWPPVLRITDDDYVVYRMSPEWVRTLDLSRPTIIAGGPEEMFEEVEL